MKSDLNWLGWFFGYWAAIVGSWTNRWPLGASILLGVGAFFLLASLVVRDES